MKQLSVLFAVIVLLSACSKVLPLIPDGGGKRQSGPEVNSFTTTVNLMADSAYLLYGTTPDPLPARTIAFNESSTWNGTTNIYKSNGSTYQYAAPFGATQNGQYRIFLRAGDNNNIQFNVTSYATQSSKGYVIFNYSDAYFQSDTASIKLLVTKSTSTEMSGSILITGTDALSGQGFSIVGTITNMVKID
jgi:hypothetical protein